MATTNAIIQSRIDSQTNWNNNPGVLIKPGEICFIENSTNFKVNNTDTDVPFSQCTTFKGSDTTSPAPGNGTTTLRTSQGNDIGSWTANQNGDTSVGLPNFVENAKVEYSVDKVKRILENDWAAGRSLVNTMPNCIPTDLVLVIIREWARELESAGVSNALSLAKDAITHSLEYVPNLT